MTQKEINDLIELAEKKLKEGPSKEEALKTFMDIGVLDAEGNTQDLKKIIVQ